MHYRAISYINLPKTYDDSILAQFVVHHATDSNRTCQIFKCRFAVGQLSVNCWYTAGRQYTDSQPTGFLGALLHNYRVTNTSSEHALALVHKQTQQKARECKPLMHALAQVPHKTLLGMRGHWDSQSISACV